MRALENSWFPHSRALLSALALIGFTASLFAFRCRAEVQADAASDFRVLSRQAESARRDGRPDRAIQLYHRALAQNPGWSEGWKSLGLLLADQGEYARAREAFQNLVRVRPESGDAWVLLGLSEFRMEQYNLAVGHLERARTCDIADPALLRLLYYYSAAMMILRGDFDTAQVRLLLLAREGVASEEMMEAWGLAALRIAVLPGREPQELRSVAVEVGRLVADLRHTTVEAARGEFETLIAKYPRQPGLRYAYAKYLASHALYSAACEELRKELRNSPNDAMTLIQLATIESQRLGKPREALPLAEEAVKLAPELFAGHFVLGRILLRLGEVDGAVAELETAAKQAPQSVMVHTALLHAYNKAGRKTDAAREQDVLRRLQQYEASLKGRGTDGAEKGVVLEKDQ